MGLYDYLNINDATIEEIWRRYLRLRGLQTENDPIPLGETGESFRRAWEKYLYSQTPAGAAVLGTTTTDQAGGVITDLTKPIPKLQAGELPGELDEEAVLKAGYVLLYEHKDFGGRSFVLPPGNYKWIEDAGIPNDLISSVKVPAGWKLVAYEHKDFGGRSRSITGNNSFISDFNDMLSSAKVQRSGA